jgi:hypothetical protein
MSTLFIIISVIILILVIWYCWRLYKKSRPVSNGTWDEPAKAQAETLAQVPRANRTARQAFDLGQLYELNMLEGDIVGGGTTDGAARPPQHATINDILGNYHRALEAAVAEGPGLEQNGIILHIGNFNDRMMEDIGLPNIIFEHGDEGAGIQQALFNGIFDLIGAHVATSKNNVSRHKAEIKAEDPAISDAEAGAKLLGKMKTATSDGQNVHDNSVSRTLKQTYDRICAENNMTIAEKEAALADAAAAASNAAAASVRQIVDNPALNSNIGATDADVLAQVWHRQSLPENKGRESNLREAALSALADMSSGTGLVCVTGRTSRLLESLTLVDHDPALAGASTVEMYRNEIFDKARAHIESGNFGQEATLQAVYAECDAYADKLSSGELNKIKEDCKAAVMF